jgi:hypothetical protein
MKKEILFCSKNKKNVVVYKYSRGLYAWALTIIPHRLRTLFLFLVSLYEVIVSTSFKVKAFNDIYT